jgi:endogenous inhibitor of DNA gyrase (YacG/DUF329 family)
MPDVPLCVYCRRRPAAAAWKPFCSDRCKMADLGRWLSGDYRVPGFSEAGAADERTSEVSGRDQEDS